MLYARKYILSDLYTHTHTHNLVYQMVSFNDLMLFRKTISSGLGGVTAACLHEIEFDSVKIHLCCEEKFPVVVQVLDDCYMVADIGHPLSFSLCDNMNLTEDGPKCDVESRNGRIGCWLYLLFTQLYVHEFICSDTHNAKSTAAAAA